MELAPTGYRTNPTSCDAEGVIREKKSGASDFRGTGVAAALLDFVVFFFADSSDEFTQKLKDSGGEKQPGEQFGYTAQIDTDRGSNRSDKHAETQILAAL